MIWNLSRIDQFENKLNKKEFDKDVGLGFQNIFFTGQINFLKFSIIFHEHKKDLC